MSLRLRLFLLVIVLFTVALVAAGVAVPSLVRGFLVDQVDDDLPAARIAALAAASGATPPPADDAGGDRPIMDLGGAYVRLYDSDGALVIDRFVDEADAGRQVPDLPGDVESVDDGVAFTVDGQGAGSDTSYRVLVSTSADFGVTTVVALPLDDVDAAVERIVLIELVVGGAILALVAAGAWWLVGVGLAPLVMMEQTAESIRADRFEGAGRKRRLTHPDARTEIGRLGMTLNGMLDEIDAAFDRQVASEARLRRFVADASHELRTPLTSIRGYAQLVRRAGHDPAQVAISLARVESESVRLTRLVEDLLVLARLDEHPDLHVEEFDLVTLVGEVAADARAAEPTRCVRVLGSAVVTVRADRARIGQAVLNLVSNARAHTPRETPIELSVSAGPDHDGGTGAGVGEADHDGGASGEPGARALIAVIDHGPGVPADQIDRIFDRFARVDAGRTREAGGAGLGLAIAATIVEAHGGRIGVADTPGGGATFTIRLP